MKRVPVLGVVLAMLSAPIQAQAQQNLVLTQQAADCALGLIKFEAAVVSGADNIVVTEDTLQIWRTHLANTYPALSPQYQLEFGPFACMKFDTLARTFFQLPAVDREKYRQEWAASLPAVFQLLVQPVLVAAQQAQQLRVQQALAAEQWRNQQLRAAQQAAPGAARDPVAELQNRQQQMINQSTYNTNMTNNTINLMKAMSGRK